MTVILSGHDLTRDQLIRVARDGESVALDPEARRRMAATRAVVEAAVARGDAVYGATTAVGVLKRVGVTPDDVGYPSWMIRHHTVGQGPLAPPDLVRATMLRLANHLAEASPGVRPVIAERLVDALNGGEVPDIRTIGSVGQADLAPLADLADAVFGDMALGPGEGTALLDNNAFATAWAALAIDDTIGLLDTMDVAAAMSLEGLAANPTMLHPRIGEVRPYPGIQRTLRRLTRLLEGSALWDAGVARHLQDPLTFRNIPHVQGAARDVSDHVDAQLAIELNASQGNPIVVAAEDRVVSVADFEILPLAVALDSLRIVMATVLTAASERVVKLLGTPWSGLPTGLVPTAGTAEAGLTYLSLAGQSLAIEARLLAAPVSFELTSTSHAEGIEDRTTMAPLAARRTAEMASLGERIAAIELAVAAQAVELRGFRRGAGTERAHGLIREVVPFLEVGQHVFDMTALIGRVHAGNLRLVEADDDRA